MSMCLQHPRLNSMITARKYLCVHPFRPTCHVCRRTVAVHAKAAVDTKSILAELLSDVRSLPGPGGADTPPDVQTRILDKVAQLKAAQQGTTTTDTTTLSATWKLLWTTEKETLFIMKNAPIFGTKAGGVYQVIDVDAKRLQNVITFPPHGAFIVDSSIAVEGAQRVSFKFNAAKLKTANRDWGVPPFGQGWFDTVYCDEKIRIAQDIRGDTLMVERDGPPRIFT